MDLLFHSSLDTNELSTDELVGALDAHGVHILSGGIASPRAFDLPPAQLLQGLAQDSDARVRLAVIPYLLVHPEIAVCLDHVAAQLKDEAKLTFVCYCAAAYWLQQKYKVPLQELMGTQPDLPCVFQLPLGLSGAETDPDRALEALAKRHETLSHEPVNWRGTYEHAAQRLVKQLQMERTWQT